MTLFGFDLVQEKQILSSFCFSLSLVTICFYIYLTYRMIKKGLSKEAQYLWNYTEGLALSRKSVSKWVILVLVMARVPGLLCVTISL